MVVRWETDVSKAPLNTVLIVWKHGGVSTAYRDELGNWRERHHGRPKQEPIAWMPMIAGPALANQPGETRP